MTTVVFFIFILFIILCVTTIWLGNVSVNTTGKMILQVKSISHTSSITNTTIQPRHHQPDYNMNEIHTLIQSIASTSYIRTEVIYTQHNDRQHTARTTVRSYNDET
jgi:hypothetical protein